MVLAIRGSGKVRFCQLISHCWCFGNKTNVSGPKWLQDSQALDCIDSASSCVVCKLCVRRASLVFSSGLFTNSTMLELWTVSIQPVACVACKLCVRQAILVFSSRFSNNSTILELWTVSTQLLACVACKLRVRGFVWFSQLRVQLASCVCGVQV